MGKGEMTPHLQLYYLLKVTRHLKERRHFPRSHAHSPTFEMQMSYRLKELCEQLFKLVRLIGQRAAEDLF